MQEVEVMFISIPNLTNAFLEYVNVDEEKEEECDESDEDDENAERAKRKLEINETDGSHKKTKA